MNKKLCKHTYVALIFLMSCLGCAQQLHEPGYAQVVASRPKNIILVIGDGMGPQQLVLADLYHQRMGGERAAALARFMRQSVHGMHMPLPDRSLVNDSACSATQLAGGCSCEPRQIGLDAKGRRCPSVALEALKRGMKVGLISDTRITHATPAAFVAAVRDRDMEHEIAQQLSTSNFDLLLSGGEAFFVSNSSQCRGARCAEPGFQKYLRRDGRNLLQEVHERGVQVVSNRHQLEKTRSTPVLGLFAPSHMSDAFQEGFHDEPTLAAMTEKALELLDNPSGFFLMVEAGQIDMAGHVNDAGWLLQELFRLSRTLAVIERFARGRSDTLVILTADHETGGMGLSYRGTGTRGNAAGTEEVLDFLSNDTLSTLSSQRETLHSVVSRYLNDQPTHQEPSVLGQRLKQTTGIAVPADALEKLCRQLEQRETPRDSAACSFDPSFYPYRNYRAAALTGRTVGAHTGIVWAAGTHTTTPVAVMAQGVAQETFAEWQQAKDIGVKLLDLLP